MSASQQPEHEGSIQLRFGDAALGEVFHRVISVIRSAGGRPVAVGGCVRDSLLGFVSTDADIEVYGLSPKALAAALEAEFRIDQVGISFGVLKLRGTPIDISIPRRESKSGLGHKAFEVLSDPFMSPTEAAARRDFTINAIALDPETGTLIDPFGGVADLRAKVLRHTSDKFSEDPLRVLRAMQMAARFELTVAPETIELCCQIEPEGLALERVFGEWKKLLLRGVHPSRGLSFLKDCGWIRYFPELQALVGCPQEKEWHPEGDVWVHTLHCMDAFASQRIRDDWEDLVVGFAVLCHDFGKPATTRLEDGRLRAYGHEAVGEAPTRSFLARLTNEVNLVESVVPLVLHHMRPDELFQGGAGDNAVRRLADRVKRIDRLVRVARADRLGRPPIPGDDFPAGDWLLERARAQAIERAAPKPVVMGRHLLELGLTPGPQFGELLDACYQAQLDGKFAGLEEGLAFVKQLIRQQDMGGN